MTSLACVRFDSADLPPETRFTAWASVMPHVALGLPAGVPPGAFHCRATSWFLGDVILTRTHLSAVSWDRSAERIARDGRDTYNFMLMARGSWTGLAKGEPCALHAGQLACFDMAFPYRGDSIDSDTLAVAIARQTLDRALSIEPNIHGRIFLTALGALLVDFLLALERRLPHIRQADAPALSRALVAQVAAAIGAEGVSALARPASEGLRHRARQLIEKHLTDADLSPARLSTDLGVSRATLYRTFEPLGGVAAYVQRRRLEMVRVRLDDGRERRSLAALAQAYGFTDASHLSTAFHRIYGLTPAQLRRREHEIDQTGPALEPLAKYRAWLGRLNGRSA